MICVPINKKSISSVLNELRKAKEADIVEIWFDEIKSSGSKDLSKIFVSTKKPIIYKVTRPQMISESVLNSKPAYIDLDFKTKVSTLKKVRELSPKSKLIMSFHDFRKTPKDIQIKRTVTKMKKRGADVIKIATYAKTVSDSLRILSLLENYSNRGYKCIFVAMGKKGVLTRTTGHLFGNLLMFAPLNLNSSTAEGQISIKDLKEVQKIIQ